MDVPNLDTLIYPHTQGEHSYYTSIVTQENVVYEMAIDLVKVEANNQEIWNFHKCKMCPYKTKSFHLMRVHLKRHRVTRSSKIFNCQSCNVELYKCSDCDYRTSLQIMFNKHVKLSHCHPEVKTENGYPTVLTNQVTCNWRNCTKAYSCENCTFTTYSQLLYVSHYRRCPAKKPPQTQEITEKTEEEVYGYRLVQKQSKPEEALFPCSLCPYVARRKTTLDGHMKVKHPFPKYNFTVSKLRQHVCSKCSFKSTSYSCLKKHFKVQHHPTSSQKKTDASSQEEETEPETPPPSPPKRLFPFKKPTAKVYSCWKCTFKSAFVTGYVNHLYYRHFQDNDIEWVKCDRCSYKTIFPSHLKRHLRVKHPAHYRCSLCKFSTTVVARFKNHILNAHISSKHVAADSPQEKNFKCVSCRFETEDNEKLKEHILKKHVTTETVTCFKCELCAKYRTIDEEDLREHVLEKHVDPQQIDWFPCEMCSCKFRHQMDLKKHIMDKHIL
ncbi:hypothetical protein Zmor_022652 [Zophobas morio]|uniref:C2H2-type domain-containing protein n=1 Tax=Zophobas morio TaxID=2755281 RepID=A0AA38HWV6_9CUCU|nr:hypothetical protein Zmor_022652 [Zophobas morio]